MNRIIIGCKNNVDYNNVISALNKSDYSVFARAENSFELLRLVKQHDPDAIIIYDKLDNNLIYLDDVVSFFNLPVIIIDDEYSQTQYYNFTNNARFYYLDKIGFDSSINVVLDLLIRANKDFRELDKKVKKLENENSSNKIVNRAKFYLIETHKLTEEQAHKFITKASMKARLPKASIAKRVLDGAFDDGGIH